MTTRSNWYVSRIQTLHVSDIKLMLEDPKTAYEVGKLINSALIMAVSDLNWTTLWPKKIENEIQSVYIKDLKIHVSDTKLIIKDPKKCRWSWKIINFGSINGSFRSELSKKMTQNDWKQDPIGINQGSKNTCFRAKIEHERSKKMQMKLENL